MTLVCFLDGSKTSFDNLFKVLTCFGDCSGCKINLSKTEVIWIGSKQGSTERFLSVTGITWRINQFKCLGVTFSLNVRSMFDLNYKVKLKRIEQTLNCWRMEESFP